MALEPTHSSVNNYVEVAGGIVPGGSIQTYAPASSEVLRLRRELDKAIEERNLLQLKNEILAARDEHHKEAIQTLEDTLESVERRVNFREDQLHKIMMALAHNGTVVTGPAELRYRTTILDIVKVADQQPPKAV